ncbi:MAG: hypothetical protein V1702_03725 [Candidatus Woesearchaeota archaeon]
MAALYQVSFTVSGSTGNAHHNVFCYIPDGSDRATIYERGRQKIESVPRGPDLFSALAGYIQRISDTNANRSPGKIRNVGLSDVSNNHLKELMASADSKTQELEDIARQLQEELEIMKEVSTADFSESS